MKFKIHRFKVLGSTQDEIKKHSIQDNIFPLVVAEKMTSGRGQRGKLWESPLGNLYFSFFMPVKLFKQPSDLCFICGLAMADSIGFPSVKLKWANDIFLNNAKNGGILIEQNDEVLIAGIGVNIASIPEVQSPEYPIGCLVKNGYKKTPTDLLSDFCKSFDCFLSIYLENRSEIFSLWQKRALWYGESVCLTTDSEKIYGVFDKISSDGGLILSGKTYYSGSLRKKS